MKIVAEELVVVERFRDLVEAELARGKLESAGIRCMVADENLVRMDWFYSNAIGGLRLMVSGEDAEAARAILDEPIPEEILQPDAEGDYTQPHCPKCDSLDISFETLNRPISYTLMWLGCPVPIGKNNWKCYSCGAEWVDE